MMKKGTRAVGTNAHGRDCIAAEPTPAWISCKGDPFREITPSVTAMTRSSSPNVFHAKMRRSRELASRAANHATGIANAPVAKSPHSALYGKGPESLPATASSTNSTPASRIVLRPMSSGRGSCTPSRGPAEDDRDGNDERRPKHGQHRSWVRKGAGSGDDAS